ncbi:MAG: hypothetical protein Q9182_000135 [Xanthomendoza sp. 2 TL-2023]
MRTFTMKLSIKPDLSVVLNTLEARVEPDMSWIKGFYGEKCKKPRLPAALPEILLPAIQIPAIQLPATQLPAIQLPPIQEVEAVDLSTLSFETPKKKRPREQPRMLMPSSIELFGYTAPPRLQWTPKGQRDEEVLEYMHDAVTDLPSSEDEKDGVMSVKMQKKHKIWNWANSPEKPLPDQSFEEWVEDEERIPRKKLRYAL